MLKSITLQNFQAHENTTINLNEGLNVFVGTNDSNKSGVVRALNICLFNATFDPGYIHYGKSFSKIILVFQDGRILERERTKSKNTIVFVEADGTRSKPHNVSKMEEAIEEFTGFGLVSLDGSDKKTENLQIIETGAAHDILLGCSYETILKRLSTLLGTTEFEQVKLNLSKELNSTSSDLKAVEKLYKKSKDQFDFIQSQTVEDTISNLIDTISDIESKYTRYKKVCNLLSIGLETVSYYESLGNIISVANREIKELESRAVALKSNDSLDYVILKCNEALDVINQTYITEDKIKELEKDKENAEASLEDYKCKKCGKVVKCYDC